MLNRSIRVAGDELDEAVMSFVRMKYGLVVGQPTAETVKVEVGSAMSFESGKKQQKEREGEKGKKKLQGVEEVISEASDKRAQRGPLYTVVRGRDLASGLPKSVRLSSVEIREALSSVVRQIINAVVDTIEETPPELVGDILDHGIVLTGGGANLRGLDKMIAEETRMPVWVASDPQTAVVKGAALAVSNSRLLDKVRVVSGISV